MLVVGKRFGRYSLVDGMDTLTIALLVRTFEVPQKMNYSKQLQSQCICYHYCQCIDPHHVGLGVY
jgi:hypothetical protein